MLNHYYILFHFPTAIALLLWLYLRHPDRYLPFRNLMAVVTFAALVIHLVFPLAPPRMMTGFVDTMPIRPEHLPENTLDGAANQIASDAVAPLRLGDDRCHRRDHRAALALVGGPAPDVDGAVDHRHRQPLVDRRRGSRSIILASLGRGQVVHASSPVAGGWETIGA